MKRIGFVYHEDYLKHRTGQGHPERPERLQALMQRLKESALYSGLVKLTSTPAALEWIEQVHPRSHIEAIQMACKNGLHFLDSDTAVSADSYDVALLAAGGVLNACDAVMQGDVEQAFCAVRPPGHHAEPKRAMGFCLFNNIAIGARYLQKHHNIERICIIDWDVHHGNGTQEAFYEDNTVLFISLHQYPLYPGTGKQEERGRGAAEGTTLNFPLPAGKSDETYLDVFDSEIAAVVKAFEPGFILISAGFDAHTEDPLAGMHLSDTGFREMTARVKALADECCNGRLVAVLEGGYNLNALSRCVEVLLTELMATPNEGG